MKTLKFRQALSKMIINGSKTTTWRLFDDKDISFGDMISLVVWETRKEFARAKVIHVRELPIGDLTDDDWEGHEKFSSDKEMFETYTHYYGKEVNKNTFVKIIKFKLSQ